MKGSDPNGVKKANKQVVYECIWSHKAVTMMDTAYTVHLSHPTAASLVQETTVDNLVVKSGYGISDGGRNPVLYHVDAGVAYTMGVDLEFPKARMTTSNLEYENICFSVRVYPRDSDKDQIICLLKQRMDNLTQDSGIDRSRLLGVGMGILRMIDYKQNYSVLFERVRRWESVPIGDIIQRCVGKPIYICNDVNLFFQTKRKAAHLEDVQNVLYIVIRSGIGMTIWTDGSLMREETGNSDHIGHMTVGKNGLECKYGGHRCLGLYTSKKTMTRIYSELTGKEIKQAGDLAPLAESGDKTALQVFETCSRYLGIGIVNVVNLFDIPEMVVSASFNVSYILKSVQYTLGVREVNTIHRKVKIREGLLAESGFGLGGRLLVLDKEHMSFLEG